MWTGARGSGDAVADEECGDGEVDERVRAEGDWGEGACEGEAARGNEWGEGVTA